MPIYDDVASSSSSSATSGAAATSSSHSPTSTVLTDACYTSNSPTISSSILHCPVYENVEKLTQLCALASGNRQQPPISMAKPSLSIDFLKAIPPPPIHDDDDVASGKKQPTYIYQSSTTSTRRSPRLLDMRPLSVPHREMQRIEQQNSTRTLIVILAICTLFVVLFAFGLWYFYDDIERQINKMVDVI